MNKDVRNDKIIL